MLWNNQMQDLERNVISVLFYKNLLFMIVCINMELQKAKAYRH